MIVTRHADDASDVVIARGQLQAGACRVLADSRAVELLPRRGALRDLGQAAKDAASVQVFVRQP